MSVASKTTLKPALLALADGTVLRGMGFGALRSLDDAAVGELVFNTSMFGYQEILTDPSYAGQTVCFTSPHIGNVGCNEEDDESDRIHATGMVIRDLSPVVSNFRALKSLERYLADAGQMGICNIDTRLITTHLRDNGAQMCAMACGDKINPSDLVDIAKAQGSMLGKNYVSHVTCKEPYTWNESGWSLQRARAEKSGYKVFSEEHMAARPHVVAIDCGIKRYILRLLVDSGFRVTVVPANYNVSQIMALSPDALFLSNGPGDPATLGDIVSVVKQLVGRFPIFGICLGHQILGQVFGGKTYKLKFGHRGGNHPVKDMTTGKVEITVQNHGFAVDADTLPKDVRITHLNLNDRTVEGLDSPGYKSFSIQYHPESSPGPHDARYLFKRFFEMVATSEKF